MLSRSRWSAVLNLISLQQYIQNQPNHLLQRRPSFRLKPEKAEKAAEAPSRDAWLGKWVGVEGLVLTIEKDPSGPGRYRLINTYSLDEGATGTFAGVATNEGIAFTRPDGAKVLRATDGAATGLKYLDGKKDCLTVGVGEGYCRD